MRSLLLLLALIAVPAQAHLLKLFAFSDGQQISGQTYFAGGTPAAGALIQLRSSTGNALAETRSDSNGEFRIAANSEASAVHADTGDGHQADWSLEEPAATRTTTNNDLQTQIESAVARQIAPLRLALQQHAARARLSDIVGGIGLLFGLAGIAIWWRHRR